MVYAGVGPGGRAEEGRVAQGQQAGATRRRPRPDLASVVFPAELRGDVCRDRRRLVSSLLRLGEPRTSSVSAPSSCPMFRAAIRLRLPAPLRRCCGHAWIRRSASLLSVCRRLRVLLFGSWSRWRGSSLLVWGETAGFSPSGGRVQPIALQAAAFLSFRTANSQPQTELTRPCRISPRHHYQASEPLYDDEQSSSRHHRTSWRAHLYAL